MRFSLRAALLLVTPLLFACHHAKGDGPGGDGGGGSADLAGADFSSGNPGLDVTPETLSKITVALGAQTPTLGFAATLGGTPVEVTWTLDRGDLATLGSPTGTASTFAPTGTTGGMVNVKAQLGTTTVTRQVFIQIDGGTQNGLSTTNPAEMQQTATSVGQLGTGGGIGGVGGEGLGGAVTDPATIAALGAPSAPAGQALTLIYPYDSTLFPRGMLAPLLMWSWTPGDADAIKIDLSTSSGSFKWSGTFSAPAVLSQSGAPNTRFIRHPIPQDIWAAATNTAGGVAPDGTPDKLTVQLTVAKGGAASGPVAETWTIAPTRLTGTVYYNSYGTSLVSNWGGNKDTTGRYIGGAILGISSGDTGPHLVVGQNSAPTDDSGCRVCHIVASRGRYLIAQSENSPSYLYDLNAADVQGSAVHLPMDGTFAWAAMTSDASYALTNAVDPSSSNDAIQQNTSALYAFGSPAGSGVLADAASMFPAGVAAAYPGFSPDDKFAAYTDVTGSTTNVTNRPMMLATYDASTQQFGMPSQIYQPPMGTEAGYPAFLPDDSGILFEQSVRDNGENVMVTRNSSRSQIWWMKTSGTPTATVLKNLNGLGASASYLPAGANNHGLANTGSEVGYDDTSLDYEPTVLPIIEGGYAWVVFTSRRLYGNQCTTDPWASNPTAYDLQNPSQAPTKKIWVAAIDLNAPAGSDPSHPAFYLPAQELGAGNSRGFFVLDPCHADGQSCASGDQCCGGFCEPDGTTGALVCGSTASCANLQEKCTTAANCCDSTNACINGFCASTTIQ